MTRSMTAFATLSEKQDWGTLVWEIRSVNHRYLDVSLRLPDELRSLENTVRERIAANVQRGKVDCTLRFKPATGFTAIINVNESLAQAVIDACQLINKKLHQPSEMNPVDILRWPGVVSDGEVNTQSIIQAALNLLDQVLAEFVTCRKREGERLLTAIQLRCDAMSEVVTKEIARRPTVTKIFRDKLLSRLNELQTTIDMNRFEQEVAYLIQKTDIDEEMDRLKSHLVELNDIFKRKEAVGRRLDFIMQELNREANTIGSKSVDIETTQASVELKVLIEQMREQIQNIE
ncbi:MAG: YicC family protein [Gammaproteobacteria bacterium]|nr:YicC family protein [Gammaproteobacteria bacterium]